MYAVLHVAPASADLRITSGLGTIPPTPMTVESLAAMPTMETLSLGSNADHVTPASIVLRIRLFVVYAAIYAVESFRAVIAIKRPPLVAEEETRFQVRPASVERSKAFEVP